MDSTQTRLAVPLVYEQRFAWHNDSWNTDFVEIRGDPDVINELHFFRWVEDVLGEEPLAVRDARESLNDIARAARALEPTAFEEVSCIPACHSNSTVGVCLNETEECFQPLPVKHDVVIDRDDDSIRRNRGVDDLKTKLAQQQ